MALAAEAEFNLSGFCGTGKPMPLTKPVSPAGFKTLPAEIGGISQGLKPELMVVPALECRPIGKCNAVVGRER